MKGAVRGIVDLSCDSCFLTNSLYKLLKTLFSAQPAFYRKQSRRIFR